MHYHQQSLSLNGKVSLNFSPKPRQRRVSDLRLHLSLYISLRLRGIHLRDVEALYFAI